MRGQDLGSGQDATRWLVIAGGGLLVMAGLKRRSFGGIVLAGLGTALVARGMRAGADDMPDTNVESGDIHRELGTEYPEARTRRWKDTVQESSEESFPASDAPSWTPTTTLGPHADQPGSR